jgi:hypothetical protein
VKSPFWTDRFRWRDAVVIAVWLGIFVVLLPYLFLNTGWDNLTLRLFATFVASSILATGGAMIAVVALS